MNYYRHKIEVLLFKAICRVTDKVSTVPDLPSLYRTRVLSGPIRGMYFSVPELERLSFALGTYESHIVQCMRRFITPGATAYDIGANAGYFTLLMSKIVQSNGHVLAFEPDPRNFAALKANIQHNSINNVIALQNAVNEITGTVTFATFNYSLVGHIATPNTPDDAHLLQVQSISLDDVVYKEGYSRPDFIKIDVEGAEDLVIYGADKVLRESKPIIVAEVREGTICQNIVEFMSSHDYRYEFLAGGWQPQKHHLGDMIFIPNTRITI